MTLSRTLGVQVKGFPTLNFVSKDGTVSTYSGGRTEKDLIAYVTEQSGSKAILTAELPRGFIKKAMSEAPAVVEPSNVENSNHHAAWFGGCNVLILIEASPL